ncbi:MULTISPECIES: type VII toxin-antitoxin system MntA family adenylyltransferase antitoxin [unclassified Pseudomonas]|uniref:type VII toxin-antitoxin system MntA family adenylyltransferase antitoxin n=1 Tax=unclassified Pseudomonas TaxID=196821 RepID=UPI001661064B|nr:MULTISPECIES: nucleotidyltransferase domain-containing protein [unclassified Pseudomonas]MBD0703602.1 DNA polymerase subunit beta [Pseudomonas sp. PSB1]MDR8386832.1 nucleotidyltransferase domain-containing protein [Pseudomonas sp. JL2]MEA1029193.1 nucleotidyltransferase domain-containing protein [Pseudomonas sp. N-137]
MNIQALLTHLQNHLPGLLAVYLFGSHAQGTAGPDSDVDIAVLLSGEVDPVSLWQLSGDLADIAGSPVDLIDLRGATTVMQYQIVTRGQRLWARDVQAGLFECFILSEKTALDEARAGLLKDIQEEGSVYGR